MIDQMLLGEITSEQEWEETLQEYDDKWFIGVEKESEWTEAILNNTPFMFSMGHNIAQVIITLVLTGFFLCCLYYVAHQRACLNYMCNMIN